MIEHNWEYKYRQAVEMRDTLGVYFSLRQFDLQKSFSILCNTTALGFLSWKGTPDQVDLVIEAGADPDFLDTAGMSPLHHVFNPSQLCIAQRLIDHGADINISSPAGLTPLHKASMYGHKFYIEYLLRSGANINLTTKSGRTVADLALNSSVLDLLDPYI